MQDPNLSHFFVSTATGAMIIAREKVAISKLENTKYAFQAGPLLVSSGAVAVSDRASWHASEPHERTAIAIDRTGKISWYATKTPISLRGFASEVLAHNPQVETLLNLDGGPSTAYSLVSGEGFRIDTKLPYFFVAH